MAELAYSKLNGFSWFGLVVYFTVSKSAFLPLRCQTNAPPSQWAS